MLTKIDLVQVRLQILPGVAASTGGPQANNSIYIKDIDWRFGQTGNLNGDEN